MRRFTRRTAAYPGPSAGAGTVATGSCRRGPRPAPAGSPVATTRRPAACAARRASLAGSAVRYSTSFGAGSTNPRLRQLLDLLGGALLRDLVAQGGVLAVQLLGLAAHRRDVAVHLEQRDVEVDDPRQQCARCRPSPVRGAGGPSGPWVRPPPRRACAGPWGGGAARCAAPGRRGAGPGGAGWRGGAGGGRAAAAARAISALHVGAAGHTQAAGLRAGVLGDLAGRGRHRAPGDQLGLGLTPADADRKVGRAGAAAGAIGHELLDAAVLQRVEGDGGQAAAGAQQRPGRGQRAVDRAQLVVHRDADGLEHAPGRVAPGEVRGDRRGALDDLHELVGALDRRRSRVRTIAAAIWRE